MPGPQRQLASGVIGQLAAAPHRFEFFQAVRLLRLYFRDGASQGAAAVDERIRFGTSLSLAFPSSEIESLRWRTKPIDGVEAVDAVDDDDGARPKAALPPPVDTFDRATLVPSFIGLVGNQGAMPRWYTERLNEREGLHRDHAARAFLDIFSHRATAQFYQAWLKYRLHFQYEENRRERFLPMLLSLIGLGSTSLRDQLHGDDGRGVLDETLAHFAGVLRGSGKSASTISGLLSTYFRAPVDVTQFVGRWFDVPEEQLSVLGRNDRRLGDGALCGTRVWQRENRMRIRFGPLRRDAFDALLPQGHAAASLARLLLMLTGSPIEYEIRLILQRDEVRPASLVDDASVRLGFDSWLISETPNADRDDAGYDIQPQWH